MTSTSLSPSHLYSGLLGFFRRRSHKEAPQVDHDGLDRATRHAIRNLSAHLLRDIGVAD